MPIPRRRSTGSSIRSCRRGAELDAKEAEQAAESGDVAAAERGFRDALAEDPENEDAGLGLAKLLIDRGEFDEARALVAKHLPPAPEAERLRSVLAVHDWAEGTGDGTLAGRSGSRRPAIGRPRSPA